jgi:hypothetical protein
MKGKVLDAKTGYSLPGANIYVSDLSGALIDPATGTTSTADGSFIIENKGRPVAVRYIGYQTQIISPSIDYALVNLEPEIYQLPPVTITPNKFKWLGFAGLISIIYLFITKK